MSSLFGTTEVETGRDALFELNGVKTTRSSNTFEVEGITYTLNQITGEGDANALKINLTRDTDKIKNLIVDFVKDYNEMIKYINGKVREEKLAGYDPLTEDEKARLTEYEIKEWETQAKMGLLRSDPLLRDALMSLSNSIFLAKSDGGAGAYGIGIMQTGSYSDGGQIKLDIDQLEKALRENPDEVVSFFTGANGLANKEFSNRGGTISGGMSNVLTYTASTELISMGTLVLKAGTPGKSSEYFNEISVQARERNEQITLLLEKLTKKQDELYNRYSKMEVAMNKMQQQLNSLSSMTMK